MEGRQDAFLDAFPSLAPKGQGKEGLIEQIP